jgi:hypothetical protein
LVGVAVTVEVSVSVDVAVETEVETDVETEVAVSVSVLVTVAGAGAPPPPPPPPFSWCSCPPPPPPTTAVLVAVDVAVEVTVVGAVLLPPHAASVPMATIAAAPTNSDTLRYARPGSGLVEGLPGTWSMVVDNAISLSVQGSDIPMRFRRSDGAFGTGRLSPEADTTFIGISLSRLGDPGTAESLRTASWQRQPGPADEPSPAEPVSGYRDAGWVRL